MWCINTSGASQESHSLVAFTRPPHRRGGDALSLGVNSRRPPAHDTSLNISTLHTNLNEFKRAYSTYWPTNQRITPVRQRNGVCHTLSSSTGKNSTSSWTHFSNATKTERTCVTHELVSFSSYNGCDYVRHLEIHSQRFITQLKKHTGDDSLTWNGLTNLYLRKKKSALNYFTWHLKIDAMAGVHLLSV